MDTVQTVVIGAGVVGLATARALALTGREVLVLEAAGTIGSETSSRNSEVIHAGIYYPEGSVKAQTCVAGKHRLYAYCSERGIGHRQCGKFIVATSEAQVPVLEQIKDKAARNGVGDLAWRTPEQVREAEPAVHCCAALFSPSTGIVDSHGLMLSLLGDLEDQGGMVAFQAPVERMCRRSSDSGVLVTVGGAEPLTLLAEDVINAAGLHAPLVAQRLEGDTPHDWPQAHYCKGSYFTLSGRNPFHSLIYPVPEAHGLGVHVTVDLGGQARFGPDVEWVDDIDYDVEPRRADSFYAAIRRYWPELPDGALQPGYSGIRPKLGAKGSPAADFQVMGPAKHGIPGLVHLFGIESPGLTASLALADMVVEALDGDTALAVAV